MKAVVKVLGFAYAYVFGFVAYARKLGVRVGEGCRIYILSWGSEPFLISIGNRVTVSSRVRFITHDGSTWLFRKGSKGRFQKYLPIVVGDDVFIGANSILMPGVTVGSRVVIGAGTVVTKNVPDNSVVVGNPGRVVRSFDSLAEKISATCVFDDGTQTFSSYEGKVKWFVEKAAEISRDS